MLGFIHAFRGLKQLVTTERNFRIQFILFIFTLITSWYFNISNNEWLVILLISAVVLSLEALNSSIERLCDLYSTKSNASIKWIKDTAAAAVLIASIIAAIMAGIIFVPKIINLLN